jgi:hypothetical protein
MKVGTDGRAYVVLAPDDLVAAVEDALGVTGFTPSIRGGQKLVGPATLTGQSVMVKVVVLPAPPEPVLERAQREVELLADIDSPRESCEWYPRQSLSVTHRRPFVGRRRRQREPVTGRRRSPLKTRNRVRY